MRSSGKPYNGNDRVFETVHDAVSSAEDGDVVLVYPGIYNLLSQSVCLDRAVTLRAFKPRRNPADPFAAEDNTGVTLTSDFGVPAIVISGNGTAVENIKINQRARLSETSASKKAGTSCHRR
jgi:hypothetical protein